LVVLFDFVLGKGLAMIRSGNCQMDFSVAALN